MSNTNGSYRSTLANVMNAYDKLPPSARRALQNTIFDWAPQPFATSFKKGLFKTGPELAEYITSTDQRTSKAELWKTWGPDYPGALPAHSRSKRRRR
jgi:hypothetical protein